MEMKRLLLLLYLIFIPVWLLSQAVFINEIHYDNTGADTGEGIEIAGPEGTDLAGWKLKGYNGLGGEFYSTVNLSGTLTDQQNGYGTLWFSFIPLQNGDPDGIALVNPSSEIIQFLSYEGSFTATDGPAIGMLSVDIGVLESSGTPIDYSMQLSGTGNDYSHFTWNSPATHTKGLVNNDQTFIPPDEDPPVWTSTYPFLDNILDKRCDLHVSLDESGIVYFLILPDGATPPTSEQVKAGIDYADVIICTSGSFEVSEAETEVIEVLAVADPETLYDICVAAEDLADTPNLQASPVLLEATTTGARSLTITKPVTGETYDVGSSITFGWSSANIAYIYIGGFDRTHDEYFVLSDESTGEPLIIDATLEAYDYTIPNATSTDIVDIIIYDVADTSFKDIVYTVYLQDALPPAILETFPDNSDIDVSVFMTPMAYFDEEIFAGSGNVVIRNEDNSVFEIFDFNAKTGLQIADQLLIIIPSLPFSTGSEYYIELDAGVVIDYADNAFAGLAGIDGWSFTTELSEDATLNDLKVGGFTVDGFDPLSFSYTVALSAGTTIAPPITATPANEHADVTINNATDVTGTLIERTAAIVVVSQDLSSALTYYITYEIATSLIDEPASQMKIYPVPVSTELILQNISDVGSIEILDITGSRVMSLNLSGEKEYRIPVSEIRRGIYFIRLKSDSHYITRKFVKQ